jgi:hypothetical protein
MLSCPAVSLPLAHTDCESKSQYFEIASASLEARALFYAARAARISVSSGLLSPGAGTAGAGGFPRETPDRVIRAVRISGFHIGVRSSRGGGSLKV